MIGSFVNTELFDPQSATGNYAIICSHNELMYILKALYEKKKDFHTPLLLIFLFYDNFREKNFQFIVILQKLPHVPRAKST